MRRRSHTPKTARGPIPQEMAVPRIADWLTEDERRPNGETQLSRETLTVIADARFRQAVTDWYAEWCGPYDDNAAVRVTDFDTAQRATEGETELGHIMRWARQILIGQPIAWGP